MGFSRTISGDGQIKRLLLYSVKASQERAGEGRGVLERMAVFCADIFLRDSMIFRTMKDKRLGGRLASILIAREPADIDRSVEEPVPSKSDEFPQAFTHGSLLSDQIAVYAFPNSLTVGSRPEQPRIHLPVNRDQPLVLDGAKNVVECVRIPSGNF
ncbi:MAG TPA: hypothetical protein PKL48_10400, partial [Thermodesulfobacteriota bacterium]|nr:hypothetical protein [Thermodesulfobacteriota bacterium]